MILALCVYYADSILFSFQQICDIMQLRKIHRVLKALHSNIFVNKAQNIQNEMWILLVCLDSKVLRTNEDIMDILILHINDFYYESWQVYMFWILFYVSFSLLSYHATSKRNPRSKMV